MNYELAKELKEAGFPFDENVQDLDGHFYVEAGQYNNGNPTLSELIEACGKDFGGLKRSARGFRAYSDPYLECGYFTSDFSFSEQTPEEAVARLWLKLSTVSS